MIKKWMWLALLVVACKTDGDIVIKVDDDGDEGLGGSTGSGEDPGKLASGCYPAFQDNELNVVTWNIEHFPKSTSTIAGVKSIIASLDADIIAVQEIEEKTPFMSIANSLEGWNSAFGDVRYDLDLGYYYKVDAFKSVSEISLLFNDDASAFPRQVVRLDVVHASGLEVTFLNIHLKCCSGSEDRRKAASERIKAYIDGELSDKMVIVLGDFNDEIGSDSPFQNFIDDSSNYTFADAGLTDVSYPSWPSHIDHILITNELFNHVTSSRVLKPEGCLEGYSSDVSDHRPVLASFK